MIFIQDFFFNTSILLINNYVRRGDDRSGALSYKKIGSEMLSYPFLFEYTREKFPSNFSLII